jgi:hypothetical protein
VGGRVGPAAEDDDEADGHPNTEADEVMRTWSEGFNRD